MTTIEQYRKAKAQLLTIPIVKAVSGGINAKTGWYALAVLDKTDINQSHIIPKEIEGCLIGVRFED
jgi:hypothetical protein